MRHILFILAMGTIVAWSCYQESKSENAWSFLEPIREAIFGEPSEPTTYGPSSPPVRSFNF